MATAYTSLLGLALPVTGELDGTWGDTVNNSITSLLDSSIAGTTTLSTDADVTLTTTTGAANQARQMILLCSGARTTLRTITAPAQSKLYVVINNTTGGYGVKLVGAGPTTGVTVASGKTAVLVWNGSDFVEIAPATATTATNLAGGTAGALAYQTGAGATGFIAIGASNYVLTSNGTIPAWTANTGTGNVVRATTPTLVTPILGTPTSGTLTNCTGLPVNTGISGMAANVSTFLATPTSANLLAAVTDATGSGSLVFATSPTLATPTITTSATVPLVIGGSATTSALRLRATTGAGASGADIIFEVGNNGATEAMRILNGGNFGVGTATPSELVDIVKAQNGVTRVVARNSSAGAAAQAQYQLDNGTSLVSFGHAGASFTTVGVFRQDGSYISAAGAGGLTLNTLVSQPIYFCTASTERVRIASNGFVGIGTTSPGSPLTVYAGNNSATVLVTNGPSANNVGITLNSLAGDVVLNNGNGPFEVSTGGAVRMVLNTSGNVGIGTTSPASRLECYGGANVNARITSTGANAYLRIADVTRAFQIASSGGTLYIYDETGTADRITIDATGNVAVFGAGNFTVRGAGGLGYGSGSGGAVTQATSRTTGVTLNKTNGAITLVSAAGSATFQSFTVTNSTVAATDTVIVSQKSGSDLYRIHVTNVSAGSFQITFATTGGTTTEQPVFNFSVIKAVIA